LSHVSFRYATGLPLVLDDVSLDVAPGEFVAIVGESGSGKSTLLRLLIGFETPESGAILYDGQDMAHLDVPVVRRQLGVVLQTSQPTAGTISSNVAGSRPLSDAEVWEALRLAGLEAEVREMPMGLHTVLPAHGGVFSGGQRQRLMIARAIVSRPRILLFDEATSALDNRTQAIVTGSLEQLAATRIVIAHRLSTVRRADRIVVMAGGKIVQTGRYEDLLAQPGPFASLAARQRVDADVGV
jgi:ATP-binding cassette subfamily C protein